MKAWVTVRFGTKGARTRWPRDAIEKYAEDNAGSDLRKFKIKDVEREFCRKFPLVGRWRELKETWADLMWLETVCRQNISDIWFGDKRVCGSSGLEVQAAIAC